MAFLLKSVSWLTVTCIVLHLVQLVLPCVIVKGKQKLDVIGLYRLGNKEKAPFSVASVERFSRGKLGSSKALRSSDIILMNKLPRYLELNQYSCNEGEFMADYSPEVEMRHKSSSVFGIQSRTNGTNTDVSCSIRYDIDDSRDNEAVSYVKVGVTYRMEGEMTFYTESRGYVKVKTVIIDNQIRFVLDSISRRKIIYNDPNTSRTYDMDKLPGV